MDDAFPWFVICRLFSGSGVNWNTKEYAAVAVMSCLPPCLTIGLNMTLQLIEPVPPQPYKEGQSLFGYLPDGSVNPDAPNVLYYAWIGPAVGSLIRPVGGWMSDKFGGALVTQVHTIVQTLASIACGILCWQARERLNDGKENLDLFPPFVFMFVGAFLLVELQQLAIE